MHLTNIITFTQSTQPNTTGWKLKNLDQTQPAGRPHPGTTLTCVEIIGFASLSAQLEEYRISIRKNTKTVCLNEKTYNGHFSRILEQDRARQSKVYVALYSASTQTPLTRSDMDHTVLPANNTIAAFTPSRRASPPCGRYSLRLSTEGRPGWVDLGGWLDWDKFPAPGVEPDTVTHPSTNRVRRRDTSNDPTNVATNCANQQFCILNKIFSIGNLQTPEPEQIIIMETCSCQNPTVCMISCSTVPNSSHPLPKLISCLPPTRPIFDQQLCTQGAQTKTAAMRSFAMRKLKLRLTTKSESLTDNSPLVGLIRFKKWKIIL